MIQFSDNIILTFLESEIYEFRLTNVRCSEKYGKIFDIVINVQKLFIQTQTLMKILDSISLNFSHSGTNFSEENKTLENFKFFKMELKQEKRILHLARTKFCVIGFQ